jgi:hypothetical protein
LSVSTQRYLSRRRIATPVELDRLDEFFLLNALNSEGLDQEFVEEFWDYHGERITSDWIAKYPGDRPWPWWVFDHGEERPIANPMEPEEESREMAQSSYFGFVDSGIFTARREPGGKLVGVPWLEPQADYLDRRDLLTEDERSRLAR